MGLIIAAGQRGALSSPPAIGPTHIPQGRCPGVPQTGRPEVDPGRPPVCRSPWRIAGLKAPARQPCRAPRGTRGRGGGSSVPDEREHMGVMEP